MPGGCAGRPAAPPRSRGTITPRGRSIIREAGYGLIRTIVRGRRGAGRPRLDGGHGAADMSPMPERLLFVTGHLAEPRPRRVLEGMGETPFAWEVRNLGVKVAALMTPEIIRRRIGPLEGFDRIILPGRCRGDLEA